MTTAPPPPDESFEAFYAKHVTLARQWACKMGMSDADAEDVAQDVLVSAHRHFASIEPDKRRSWLFTAVMREGINQQRKRRRRAAAAAPLCPLEQGAQEPTPTPRIMALETLRAAFDALSDEEREVLVRHEIDGETLEVIARALRISRNTAQARVAAARTRFRERVDKLGGLPEDEQTLVYAIFPFLLLATIEERAMPCRVPRDRQLAIAVPSVLAGVLLGVMLPIPLTAQDRPTPVRVGLGAAATPASVHSEQPAPKPPVPSVQPALVRPAGLEVDSRRELDDLLRAREAVAKDPAAALALLAAHARRYPQSQHAARRQALMAQARAVLMQAAGFTR